MRGHAAVLWAVWASTAMAAPPAGSARSLYSAGAKEGAPGAKLSVELLRGAERSTVAPDTVFRSGDRVRFHFATNYSGYVAVISVGSTGRRALLFPRKGASGRIEPTADYQVPQGNSWFEFDEHPGQEQLTFIMSTSPISELAPQGSTADSQGGQVSGAEEQAILEALNSRSLRNGRSLAVETSGGEAFLVADPATLANPAGFTITLVHR